MEKIDIRQICKDAKHIGISGHVRPDGDCVGSVVGMYLYLKKLYPEKDVRMYLQKPSVVFNCLKGIENVIPFQEMEANKEPVHDVFICCDANADRLEENKVLFERAIVKVNIDHHISNAEGCGDINYVKPEASSASELVYELIEKDQLDEDIALALYVGIIHDTGVFRYSCTGPSTLVAASELIKFGFNFPVIIEKTYTEKTIIQQRLLGIALTQCTYSLNDRMVTYVIESDLIQEYNACPKDFDGIVSQLRDTKGVDCALFMHQTGENEFKVSLRTTEAVDAAAITAVFGGGGHARAAGCTVYGTPSDLVAQIENAVKIQLESQHV